MHFSGLELIYFSHPPSNRFHWLHHIGKQNVSCTLIITSAIFFFNIMVGTCHGDVFPDAQNYTGSKESLPKHTACFNTKTGKNFYWEGKIFIGEEKFSSRRIDKSPFENSRIVCGRCSNPSAKDRFNT
jgi:hypothetical protein